VKFGYLLSDLTYTLFVLKGNALCKQIPWDNDQEKYLAFKEGRTGYPFIDAIMTQLRTEGLINYFLLFFYF
jgi:cryptochrome